MALNFSTAGNKKRISFGSGTMKVGTTGTTPTTDIGFINDASLNFTRQKIEYFAGFPETLVVQYVNREDVILTVTGAEWSLENLARAWATGTVSGNKLGVGGDVNLSELSIELTHQMPAGGTAVIRVWRAQGQGETQIQLGNNIHTFQQGFRALASTTDWAGATLSSSQSLFQIQLDIPPG